MYEKYFGLSHKPFAIAPDPRYLYLSPQHRDALAHLLYGVKEGGGFVLLTGEVGTGKTTLCRGLLDQLPAEVDLALILNPRLNALELVATICDELGVVYPAEQNSLKLLVDLLNAHLLKAHAEGRRTVLIIDEAQNLSPDVLEQVRLLTNLETSEIKLLEIVLIGQPELREVLARRDMRQLAQRITARYHLEPLSQEETAAYVLHRQMVGGVSRPLFTSKALSELWRLSGGIPRIINVICDRALLGAFVESKSSVDELVVRRAADEVLDIQNIKAPSSFGLGSAIASIKKHTNKTKPKPLPSLAKDSDDETVDALLESYSDKQELPSASVAEHEGGRGFNVSVVKEVLLPGGLLAVSVVLVFALLFFRFHEQLPGAGNAKISPVSDAVALVSERQEEWTLAAAAVDMPKLPLKLAKMEAEGEEAAWAAIFQLWGLGSGAGDGDSDDYCRQAKSFSLRCYEGVGGWDMLQRYDRPALLKLARDDGGERMVLLAKLGKKDAMLIVDGNELRLPRADIERYWDGEYQLLWRSPLRVDGLSEGDRGADVLRLRNALARAGLEHTADTELEAGDHDPYLFDSGLSRKLKEFQEKQGVVADGRASRETLLLLSGALADTGSPRLVVSY